jgi:methylated-DNA-protein-cysteine methyltransferase-like protein
MRRKNKPVSFFDQVYVVVKRIPKGKVATYGQVAAILEHPRAARTVGWALNGLPSRLAAHVPWHRVINAEGRISNTGNAEEQLRRLQKEGIKFDKTGHCDLRKYLWEPPAGLTRPALLAGVLPVARIENPDS